MIFFNYNKFLKKILKDNFLVNKINMQHKKNKLVRITTLPISFEKLLPGQLYFMSYYYDVYAISSAKNQLEEFAKNEKANAYSVNLTRKITPFTDIIALWKLYKFLRLSKPSIVHTHTPKAGLLGMLAAKAAGIRIRLHTVAGLPLMEASGLKKWILKGTEKVTYACATKVYPNSFGLKQIIINYKFCNPDKLKIIANGSSNGVDVSYFNPSLITDEIKNKVRKSLNIEKNDFTYLYVGRIVGDKGINELVEAFDKLYKTNSNIKLLLVGYKEAELDKLKQKTEDIISSHPAIISTGFHKDVRAFYAISNVLVLPSYREGFPNVLMQAGAMGLFCIATDINGCNEIIEDEENGFLVPPKDTDSLFNAMSQVLLQRDERGIYNDVARQRVCEKYNSSIIWNALLEEYKNFEENV